MLLPYHSDRVGSACLYAWRSRIFGIGSPQQEHSLLDRTERLARFRPGARTADRATRESPRSYSWMASVTWMRISSFESRWWRGTLVDVQDAKSAFQLFERERVGRFLRLHAEDQIETASRTCKSSLPRPPKNEIETGLDLGGDMRPCAGVPDSTRHCRYRRSWLRWSPVVSRVTKPIVSCTAVKCGRRTAQTWHIHLVYSRTLSDQRNSFR